MMRIPFALRAGTALLAVTVATSAAAQDQVPPPDAPESPATTSQEPSSEGDIVITGSRIRRDPLSQDSPIVFVDQEDIAKTGLNSVNDVLQRLPSAGGGINSKFNQSGNLGNPPSGAGVGAGAAEIDLRYLGSNRTLVLVDGLRFVNGASASGVPGSTDLNAIPDSMIERIEVLQDGASAIYGSDAIAGVVNIITKRRQEGFMASAQVGQFGQGDGTTQNYQLSWGNGSNGPLEIVVGGNFVKGDGVRSADRAISRFPQPYNTTCIGGGCSSTPIPGRFVIFGNATPTVDDPTTPDVNEDVLDLTLANPVIGPAIFPDDFRDFAGDPDRFNFAPFNFIEIPVERLGAFANVRYELTDSINLSTKLVWNRRKSKNQAAPLPLLVGPGAGNLTILDQMVFDATNPFNPFGVTLRPDDPTTPLVNEGNYDVVRRRMSELGPRRFNQDVKTWYGVATLDGKFALANQDWFWDINASYGRNKAKQRMLGNINAANLAQALGPIANCTAPCVPFNFFGSLGSVTPEMIDWISFVQNDSSEQKQWDFTANASGSLFELPGGPLGVAAGVQYRKLRGRFDPDPVIQAGLGADIPAQATKGSYNVKEAYAELNAPILSEVPFADLLEFSGAARFSDYSTSGSTTTFKAQVNWKPIEDLRLRGSWAEGFRAPHIGELFGTFSRFDSAFDDPCSSESELPRNIDTDPTVAANCLAQGGVGANTVPDDQFSVITGGNPDLKAETSKSWVFGGVYSPSFLQRLSVEVNWYKISIDDAIQAFPAQLTVTNCIYDNDPTACARISRAPSGNIIGIDSQLQNVAGIRTKGIDANLTYRTARTSAGTFGFTWNNTFLRNFDLLLPVVDGIQVDSREGDEIGSPSQAYPKWKSIGVIDWDMGLFGASITGRYIKSVEERAGPSPNIPSRFYTDVQLRWFAPNTAERLGFAFGVRNLFNTKTPACFTCDINGFDPTTYDTPGRYFYFRMNAEL